MLEQLGDVLGMNNIEILSVHQKMSEEAFKLQVKKVVEDSNLADIDIKQLEDLAKNLNLTKNESQKIIVEEQNKKTARALKRLKMEGNLRLETIRKVAEQGVAIAEIIDEDTRIQMFRSEVE